MGSPIFQLTVKRDFSAAHQLRNYGGKCEHLHGHNFGVEATVEGCELAPDTEILMDFGELKRLLDGVLAGLDHKMLNELDHFCEKNPSSENLAQYIYKALAPLLPGNVSLVSVAVSEKDSSRATYKEV